MGFIVMRQQNLSNRGIEDRRPIYSNELRSSLIEE